MATMRERFVIEGEANDARVVVASFEAFYHTHYRSVLRTALALTHDMGAAEDITQDAFLAARQNWNRIAGYDKPEMWVRKVVANKSVSRFRRRLREARAMARVRDRQTISIDSWDSNADVWKAIASLPKRQAQTVVLAYIQDMSVDDVAETLSCGPETVRTHLRRARAKLAVLLSEEDS